MRSLHHLCASVHNGRKAKKVTISLTYSTLLWKVVCVLGSAGYLQGFGLMEYNGVRKIILRPDLQGVTLVAPKGSPTAQPISWADLCASQTLSTTIMSTTLGVMTCEQAKAYKIGGLPLLTVGPPRA